MARVNAGGPVMVAAGVTWGADAMFVGGVAAPTTGQGLYATLRQGAAFNYSIPVAAGAYVVRLHFSELCTCAKGAGDRLFTVSINKKTVLPLMDVVAVAGWGTPHVVALSVAVTGKKITVAFESIKGLAFVNAIEIVAA